MSLPILTEEQAFIKRCVFAFDTLVMLSQLPKSAKAELVELAKQGNALLPEQFRSDT